MQPARRIPLFLVGLIAAISLVPVLASGSGVSAERGAQGEGTALTICPEPRPQICTMDYRPVCGEREDGSSQTYSNGCGACSDPQVVGYRDGECGAEK